MDCGTPIVEEKVYKCPKIFDTEIKSDKPKTEIRRMQYEKECKKDGKTAGLPKKSGAESCCPPPSKIPQRLISAALFYSGLGGQAGGVLGGCYNYNNLKLNVKLKTSNNITIGTGIAKNLETEKTSGSLSASYTLKDWGISFAEKWTTDKLLTTEVSKSDAFIKGLTLSADLTFHPDDGLKSTHVKSAFKNKLLALNLDFDLTGPAVIDSAIVLYHEGWYAGYQTGYNTDSGVITKNNFALGFSTTDFILHTYVNDLKKFGASFYQKITPKIETGIQFSWESGEESVTNLAVGVKYDMDGDTSLRAKIDNFAKIGLCWSQRLREGISMAMSALIDGANINEGGHKIGLSLDFEA